MNVYFEELAAPQRAGGIESVTRELVTHLRAVGVTATRSSEQAAVGVPDCVHLHGIWSPSLASRFSSWTKRGVPCIVSPHGMLEPWALSHKGFKKKVAWHVYQKRLLNQAAMLHGTSEREVLNFKTLGLTPPIVLVPWGVDVPPQNRKSEIRTALFVGRIYPVKGLPLLVEAWAKVRPPGWKMKIVGPDEAGHRGAVEALIRQAKLEGVFEFTGALQGQALRQAYETTSLFVLPSYSENFGMVVAEALAHSLPVLTTTGTPWSVLPERGCGWWVSPTADQIAQALAAATALDVETLQVMGSKGRELVAEKFSWGQTAGKMKAAYQWVLGQGSKPDFLSG